MVGFMIAPMLMNLLKVGSVDSELIGFFHKIIQTNFEIRETQDIDRPDFIQLLQQLKQGKAVKSDEELAAQCLMFVVAGLETTSTLLHFVAYELALNPAIQNKLVAEIQATNQELKGQSLTHDALQKMVYLDLVILEGLRKWPPVPIVDRVCTDEYQLHIDDYRSVIMDKDQLVLIPIYAFHHDPNNFPNPEKFDPDRFNEENKHKIRSGTFIPFGTGPRNCLGSRFALLNAKAVLYYLLLNFSLEVNASTQVPLEIKKGIYGLTSESGVHLDLVPRTL
jgi:cytochrome P450 family 9